MSEDSSPLTPIEIANYLTIIEKDKVKWSEFCNVVRSTIQEYETSKDSPVILENIDVEKSKNGKLELKDGFFKYSCSDTSFEVPCDLIKYQIYQPSDYKQSNASIIFILSDSLDIGSSHPKKTIRFFTKSTYTVKAETITKINQSFTNFVNYADKHLGKNKFERIIPNWKLTAVGNRGSDFYFRSEKLLIQVIDERGKVNHVIDTKDLTLVYFQMKTLLSSNSNMNVEMIKSDYTSHIIKTISIEAVNLIFNFFNSANIPCKKNFSYKNYNDMSNEEREELEPMENIVIESPTKKRKIE